MHDRKLCSLAPDQDPLLGLAGYCFAASWEKPTAKSLSDLRDSALCQHVWSIAMQSAYLSGRKVPSVSADD